MTVAGTDENYEGAIWTWIVTWITGVCCGSSGYSGMTILPDGNLLVGFRRGGNQLLRQASVAAM